MASSYKFAVFLAIASTFGFGFCVDFGLPGLGISMAVVALCTLVFLLMEYLRVAK